MYVVFIEFEVLLQKESQKMNYSLVCIEYLTGLSITIGAKKTLAEEVPRQFYDLKTVLIDDIICYFLEVLFSESKIKLRSQNAWSELLFLMEEPIQ